MQGSAAALVAGLILFATPASWAATFSCGSGVCNYTGTVFQLYTNTSGDVLLYFQILPDQTEVQAEFPTVTIFNAGVVPSTFPEFVDRFLSIALTAQASGREVTLQMNGEQGGRLSISKIWLKE